MDAAEREQKYNGATTSNLEGKHFHCKLDELMNNLDLLIYLTFYYKGIDLLCVII